MYRSVKTKRTLFTEEKIANLHKNIEKFDWAKEKAEKIIAAADNYLRRGVDALNTWYLPQEIGRSYYVNQAIGCPNCGKLEFFRGDWAQRPDGEEGIAQTTCPGCGKRHDMDNPKCPVCGRKNPIF